ncbi:MAG: phenylacetate--CoA ligase family protein [Christensenellales bacterium]|jgi:phenylacetate-CoA ligase
MNLTPRIWDPKHECMSREDMQAMQLRRLQLTVARVYTLVPFYRRKMDELGVKPEHIQSLKDIRLLPFTVKQDLRDTYPDGLFAADRDDIVRVHASSGTTGKPIVMGYTRKDLDVWSDCVARALSSVGADTSSVVQVSYGYGLFTGGLGAHDGAQKVGAMVVPTSGGNTRRQVMMMRDLGSTHLCCTPSYAMYLSEAIEKEGISKDELKLRVGLFGAEAWSEDMRAELERRLGIKARDIYGLTEISGPGVSMQCLNGTGMHIQEDHFYPEIIDPDTLEPLPEGETGELVFTTISKEGIPLLRYRTRDITNLTHEPCVCGRTTVRMGRILGRTDDMLIIRGVNVFPSQVESALLSLGMEPHYQIIVERINNLDQMEIQVEMSESMFSDQVRVIEQMTQRIHKEIEAVLGISCRLTLMEPHTIPRSEGKAKRVIDKRKL